MATTRSNEELHPRRALGFLMNPRRMNGQAFSLSPRVLPLKADASIVSGHYARAIIANFNRRPRSIGDRQILAYFPELHHVAERVNRKSAQLESPCRGSGAFNGSHPEGACVVRGGVYQWEEREHIQVQPRGGLKMTGTQRPDACSSLHTGFLAFTTTISWICGQIATLGRLCLRTLRS